MNSMDWVMATALPVASTTERWVVSPSPPGAPALPPGVTIRICPAIFRAYFSPSIGFSFAWKKMSGSKGILSRSLSALQKERARTVAPAGESGESSSGAKFSRMFKIATRALPEPGGGNVRKRNFRYLPFRAGRS